MRLLRCFIAIGATDPTGRAKRRSGACGSGERLFRLHAISRRLIVRLEQRFNGEPEIGETKWLQRKDRR